MTPPEALGFDEPQLAARNHGMPLEALRHPTTPVGQLPRGEVSVCFHMQGDGEGHPGRRQDR